jgi:hypothetical protein
MARSGSTELQLQCDWLVMADLRPSETSPDPKQLQGLFQTESAGEIVLPPNHSHRFRTCAIERDIRLFLLGSPQQKK